MRRYVGELFKCLVLASALILVFFVSPAHAGDVEIDLNSADGSTDFELRDSGGNIQFDIDSDGNTSWPQGADDSDLTVPTYAGNPDTVITAPEGSVAYDTANDTLYMNTDGATNWEALADGGGGGSAVVAGSSSQVQFNAAGSFGADAGFAYNAATDTLTAMNATFTTVNNATIGSVVSADATFSAMAVDVNVFYVDPNKNNVGIGTTAPGARLEITSNIDGDPLLTLGANTVSGIVNVPGNLYINADSNNDTASNEWMAFAFDRSGYSGGAEVIRLLKNGNIGIGALEPEKKLHVAGTLTATDATFETINNAQIGNSAARDATFTDITVTGSINGVVGSSAAGDGTFTALNVTTGNVGIGTTTPAESLHIYADVTPRVIIDGPANQYPGVEFYEAGSRKWVIYNEPDDGLTFQDDTSTRMVIRAGGNVGVGTSTPNEMLHVEAADNENYAANSFAAGTTIKVSNTSNNNDGVAKIHFQGISDGITNGAAIGMETNTGDSALFFQVENDTTISEAMRIIKTGNVGIGVTDPDTKLEVIGGVTAVDATFSGRLGIGTAAPVRRLQVNYAGNDATTQGYIQVTNDTTGAAESDGFDIGYYGQGLGAVINQRENSYLAVHTNNIEKVRVNADGNVGIGTTAPSALLDVQKDAAGSLKLAEFRNLDPTAGNVAYIQVVQQHTDPGTTYSAYLGVDRDTKNVWLSADSTTDRDLIVTTVGNIGIGVTDPSAPLEVAGGVTAVDATFSGKVGVGTATPGTALDVRDTFQIRNEAAYQASVDTPLAYWGFANNQDDNGRAKGYLWNLESAQDVGAQNSRLTLSEYDGWDNATPYAVPSSDLTPLLSMTNGNVGIGVTDPAGMLEIGSGQLFVPNGAAATPSVSFTNFPGNGLYTDDVNYVNVSTNGAVRWYFHTSQIHALNANGARIDNAAASATTPTLIPDRADADTGVGHAAADTLSLIAGGANVLNTTSSNVGIGTTTPNQKLQVVGNIQMSSTLLLTDTTTQVERENDDIKLDNDINGGDIIFETWDGSAKQVFIQQDGNLGVGTVAPRSILDVDIGTGYGQATLDGSSGGCLMLRDTDDAGWTECNALNGTLSCTTDADGVCDGA